MNRRESYLRNIPMDIQYNILLETDPQNLDMTCSLYPEYQNICNQQYFIDNYIDYHKLGYLYIDLAVDKIPYVKAIWELYNLRSTILYTYFFKAIIEPQILEHPPYEQGLRYHLLDLYKYSGSDIFINFIRRYWPIGSNAMKNRIIEALPKVALELLDNNTGIRIISDLINMGILYPESIIYALLSKKYNPNDKNLLYEIRKMMHKILHLSNIRSINPREYLLEEKINWYKVFEMFITNNQILDQTFLIFLPLILDIYDMIHLDEYEKLEIINLIEDIMGIDISGDNLYEILKNIQSIFSSPFQSAPRS